jgi:hypothetical protein
MAGYLYCAMETRPAPEAAVEESDVDRRDAEATRLEVPPARPGDDPPTCGDEGGGNLYPETSSEESSPTFLRRLQQTFARRFSGPA